jgi:hypothetical protein
MNTMTFPPLQTCEETPVPTPGYKESFQKYTFDSIIAIVKNVKDAVVPSDLLPVSVLGYACFVFIFSSLNILLLCHHKRIWIC